MLHASADIVLDLGILRKQAAAAVSCVASGTDGAIYGSKPDDGWMRLLLVRQDGVDGVPMPALAQIPAAVELAVRYGWCVQGIHLDRHPPGGGFPWHWDDHGIHLDAMRLLIPLHVPGGALTRIGHESISYPPGQAWTADFSVVHDVRNLGTTDRISLVFDLAVTPAVTCLFPAELAADPERRHVIAARTREQLKQYWMKGGSQRSYPAAFRRGG